MLITSSRKYFFRNKSFFRHFYKRKAGCKGELPASTLHEILGWELWTVMTIKSPFPRSLEQMWWQIFPAAWHSLLPRQQDPCPLRNTPLQLILLLSSSRKKPNQPTLSQSSPPASIANSNLSCANAVLLLGVGLQMHFIPSFNLMPGLAQRAVKGLFFCRLLTM